MQPINCKLWWPRKITIKNILGAKVCCHTFNPSTLEGRQIFWELQNSQDYKLRHSQNKQKKHHHTNNLLGLGVVCMPVVPALREAESGGSQVWNQHGLCDERLVMGKQRWWWWGAGIVTQLVGYLLSIYKVLGSIPNTACNLAIMRQEN